MRALQGWLRRRSARRAAVEGAERIAREAAHTGTWRGPWGVEVRIRWDPALRRWFVQVPPEGWFQVGQEGLSGFLKALERAGFKPDPGVATADVRRRVSEKLDQGSDLEFLKFPVEFRTEFPSSFWSFQGGLET